MNFNFEKFLNRLPLNGLGYTVVGSFFVAFLASFGLQTLIKQEAKKISISSGSFVSPSQKLYTDDDLKNVIDRNIFNIDGKVPEEDTEKEEEVIKKDEIKKTNLPLKLLGVIFSGDPEHGLAVIQNEKSKLVETFLVGDFIIDESTLFKVYPDKIIIDRGSYKEFLPLVKKKLLANSRKIMKAQDRKSEYALETPSDEYREEGFERVGNNINLSEDFKQKLLSIDFAKVLQDVKAVPHFENNELKGYRMTKLKEGSIYQKMGLQTNDIIREINGFVLDDASQVLMYLQSLRADKEFDVEVLRGGKAHVIHLQVQ